MDISEVLFYGGIAGMVASIVFGFFTILIMVRRKKRLQAKLIAEYGEK